MAQWSTGTLVAVGLGAAFLGLGLGGRIMAQFCVQACPQLLNTTAPVKMARNRHRNRRRMALRR